MRLFYFLKRIFCLSLLIIIEKALILPTQKPKTGNFNPPDENCLFLLIKKMTTFSFLTRHTLFMIPLLFNFKTFEPPKPVKIYKLEHITKETSFVCFNKFHEYVCIVLVKLTETPCTLYLYTSVYVLGYFHFLKR